MAQYNRLELLRYLGRGIHDQDILMEHWYVVHVMKFMNMSIYVHFTQYLFGIAVKLMHLMNALMYRGITHT